MYFILRDSRSEGSRSDFFFSDKDERTKMDGGEQIISAYNFAIYTSDILGNIHFLIYKVVFSCTYTTLLYIRQHYIDFS